MFITFVVKFYLFNKGRENFQIKFISEHDKKIHGLLYFGWFLFGISLNVVNTYTFQ